MTTGTIAYDLKEHIDRIVTAHRDIAEVHLFGSRAYQTRSLRSDCDILVRVVEGGYVKSSDLRSYSMEHCPPLDLFVLTGTRAISASNESFIQGPSVEELLRRVDAIRLWTRAGGFEDFDFGNGAGWRFETTRFHKFPATALPDMVWEIQTWQEMIESVEKEGLPAQPFIGDTLDRAVSQIIEVARSMIMHPKDLGQRGQAKNGWTVNLRDEYDCQNLFWTVVKPWLPGLTREPFQIKFDGQKKSADFALFKSKLVIEMKFIDSSEKKSEVVKTLAGLSEFYAQNPNLRSLLILILHKSSVRIDALQWETDFSFPNQNPSVRTRVIEIP